MGFGKLNYFCLMAVAGLLSVPALAERNGTSHSEQKQPVSNSDALARLKGSKAAVDAGDFETALEIWRQLAAEGIPGAMYNLGWAYSSGSGVPKNQGMALDWYKKAAAAGSPQAQLDVGVHYFNGTGVAADKEEAAKWFMRAAEQGLAEAQYNVGIGYANGIGLSQDTSQSIAWLSKAAAQGHARAGVSLKEVKEFVQRQGPEAAAASSRAASVLLSGTYRYSTDAETQETMGDAVCFDVDGKSVNVLPPAAARQAAETGDGIVWFCFNGGMEPKRALKIPSQSSGCGFEGRAVVEVRNYTVFEEQSDSGTSTAELVSVKSKSPPTVTACLDG